jgi:hypothetical protein
MRERALGHDRIFTNYFVDTFICSNLHFRHQFRMQHYLFLKVVDVVIAHDFIFLQKVVATNLLGFQVFKSALLQSLCWNMDL